MKGRLEHELRAKKYVQELLKGLPPYVSSFYYVINVNLEESTCREYIVKIKQFADFVGADLLAVTPSDIGRYFAHLEDQRIKEKQRNLSFSYKKMIWTVLNKFYAYLLEDGKIQHNPMKAVGRPKQQDEIKRKYLSMKDMSSILIASKCGAGSDWARTKQYKWTERDYLIILLLMITGMRCAALSEINVSDIDMEQKILTVIDKRNKTHKYPLTDKAMNAVQEWLERREELLNGKECDALFISQYRTRLHEAGVSDIVQKYANEALGEHITPHKLRAGFVTNVYEATGHDIKATCEAVGHANIATTSIYIRTKNDSRKKAITYMDQMLS